MKYSLSVIYMYSNREVIERFTGNYAEGEQARTTRPIPAGYTAEITRVSGRLQDPVTESAAAGNTTISGLMGTSNVTYEVVYSQIQRYTVNIHFVIPGADKDFTDPVIRTYIPGEEIIINKTDADIAAIPGIGNYVLKYITPQYADRDGKTVTVFLVESDDYTNIGDDLTPLGINDAVPGSGEIIE